MIAKKSHSVVHCLGVPFSVLLLLMVVFSPQAATVMFEYEARPYRVSVDSLAHRALRDLLRDTSGAASPRRVSALFDSLGYFAPHRDTLGDTVVVRGGRRSRIDTFLVRGAVPDMPALPALPATSCPYDAGLIVGVGNQFLDAFASAGYPFVSVVPSLHRAGTADTAAHRGRIAVVMTIRPGNRHLFGPALFQGMHRTRGTQLRKDVQFVPGEPFDRRLVVQTEQRLAARTYVDSVYALPPRIVAGADSLVDEQGEARVVVPFVVRERSGLGLDGAVGFEVGEGGAARLTGLLDFTLLNIFGVGERATVRYRGEQGLQKLAVDLEKAYVGLVPLFVSGALSLELVTDAYAHLAGGVKVAYELSSLWRVGVGVSAEENSGSAPDSSLGTWHVYGTELSLERPGLRFRRGRLSHTLYAAGGVALADRGGRENTRWSAAFSAGAHVPLGRFQAVAGTFVSRNLFTDEVVLTPAEMVRVGGHESIRGYAVEQFAFRNVVYSRLEYLLYFGREASTFIFVDAGLGFTRGLEYAHDYTTLLGYGLGIRIPVRVGSAALQWGRNIDDTRGWGRIHVRITNALAGSW